MDIQEILDDMSFLDGWEDRYRYIIDLGEQLDPMDPADMVEENKVHGCMSQVWMTADRGEGDDPVVTLHATSDALIVKGLIAVLTAIFSGQPASRIQQLDHKALFQQLDLEEHLSMTRRNGLHSMVQRIKALAS